MVEKTEIKSSAALPFPGVIGQAAARMHLWRAIETDRLAHAFLFVGPDGVGRTALAFELARALNCQEHRFDTVESPCQCSSCRRIRKLEHPNLSLIFPLPRAETEKEKDEAQKVFDQHRASKSEDPYAPIKYSGTGQIHIELIRQLRNEFSLSADCVGIRVAVIQPADRLNPNSANALLKILEEPPAKSCLILIANTLRTLLPTIISRCQIIRLGPLSAEEIQQALVERLQADARKTATAARLAAGSYARACSLLDDSLAAQLTDSLEFLRRAAVSDLSALASKIDRWSREGSRQETLERLDYLAVWIRDAMLIVTFAKEEAPGYLVTTGHEDVIRKIGARYSTGQLASVWEEIEEAKLDLESNALTPLVLTALAVKIRRIMK